jgi:hypothetical protein
MDAENLNLQPPPNLMGRPLSSAVKRALVAKTQCVHSTYVDVMDKYNVRYYTLRKYYKRINRGLPTYEKDGRPTVIDQISQEEVMLYMTYNPGFNKLTIHGKIREEMKKTLNR